MEKRQLSSGVRVFVFVIAVLYTVLGLAMFLLPKDMAPDFAWKVTPFMTMTLGGWCLGNAWLAWAVGKRWTFSSVYPGLIYLSTFGICELLVLLWFRDKIVLDHAIAWLYLVTLIANGLLVPWLAVEYVMMRPRIDRTGPQIGRARLIGVWAFLVFVGFLGVYGLLAQQGDPGLNRGIFPELLSPFTLRAFGAFYLSIMVGTFPLAFDWRLSAFLSHGFVSYGLILFITAAAFVYIHLFDFIDRPGGAAYFGAYLIVGVVFAIHFPRYGTGGEPESTEAPAVAA
jgi:hypothetical protein